MGTDFILYNSFKIENALTEDEKLIINGYCAHFGVKNLNEEVVDANSFNEFFSLYDSGKLTPCLNYNHNSDQIIGGIDYIERTKNGLFMTAHLNKNVPLCDMLIPNILSGDISGLSTEGFVKNGVDGVEFLDEGGYYVKDFLLTGVAVVSTPADWNAQFTVKNYLDANGFKPEQPKSRIWMLL